MNFNTLLRSRQYDVRGQTRAGLYFKEGLMWDAFSNLSINPSVNRAGMESHEGPDLHMGDLAGVHQLINE